MSAQRPTIAQVRAVVQPPTVMSRANAEHWTGTLYMRRLSVYLTYALVQTRVSANGVTILMIITGFLAGPALLLPGLWGPLVAMLLAQLQMLLDCSDGEVARWRGTSSPKGIFLDQVGHYAAEGSIGIFLGLRAAGIVGVETSGSPGDTWKYAFVGAMLLAGIWLNKSLNLMVVVARQNAGLERLPDVPESREVASTTFLGRARRLARFLPFHRLYHSIEITIVTFVVALVTAGAGDRIAVDRTLVLVLAVAIWVVVVGHSAAIWSSRRLQS